MRALGRVIGFVIGRSRTFLVLLLDSKVIVPPLYHSIAQPVGAYCAFEQIPRHGGVMTWKGQVIDDAKSEKVEIRDNGIAVVTGITGKTQTI